MKIVAKRPVQVSGFGIVSKGQTIDVSPELIDERIAANFRTIDGGEIKATKESREATEKDVEAIAEKSAFANCIESLGREGIRRKLDDMGITYSPNAKTEYLAKLYLTQVGVVKAETE